MFYGSLLWVKNQFLLLGNLGTLQRQEVILPADPVVQLVTVMGAARIA
jgi:hypothetical protein